MSNVRADYLPLGVPAAPGAPPSAAELVIVGFIIVVALYLGQVVLVPLALAVILSFVLAPAVRILKRGGLPNGPSVVLVVIVAFAIIFGIGALITQQVASLAQELPRYQVTLKEKVGALRDATAGSGGAIKQAGETLKALQEQLEAPPAASTTTVTTITPLPNLGAGNRQPIPVEVHTPAPTPLDQLQSIIGVVLEPLATVGAVLLFVLFLLLQREDVRDRAIRLLGAYDLERSTTAMDDAGNRLSKYFLGMTAINAAFGIVVGVGLWIIGVPSPVLWGVLAMLMRFVPFIGSFIAAACPLMLAAAVDPGWSMFLWTLALYAISEPIMGSVIEPLVQGHRTGLSPLAIILAAAFWTLLWGPIGLLLATPLTVVLVVLGRHVERLEFLNVMLGDTPPLSPPERFYQRMLAGDPAEAVEQAEKFIKEQPLVDYYDEVVVEGLRLAQVDADRGTLEPDRLRDIRDTADVVIDTLADHDLVPKKRAIPVEAKPDDEDSEKDPAKAAAEQEDAEEKREIDEPIELALSDDWKAENAVLCVASRNALDETVALALARMLEKFGIGAKVVDPEHLRHGNLSAADIDGARIICISTLDARERDAHARFLTRRLKRAAPDATILGGFWKLDDKADASVIAGIQVDATATTLREAVRFCVDTARADSDESTAAQVESMRVDTTTPPDEARPAAQNTPRPTAISA